MTYGTPQDLFGCGPTARCPQLRAAAAGCRKLRPDWYDTVRKPQPPRHPLIPNLCDQRIAPKTYKNVMFFNRWTAVLLKVARRVPECTSRTKMSGTPGIAYSPHETRAVLVLAKYLHNPSSSDSFSCRHCYSYGCKYSCTLLRLQFSKQL